MIMNTKLNKFFMQLPMIPLWFGVFAVSNAFSRFSTKSIDRLASSMRFSSMKGTVLAVQRQGRKVREPLGFIPAARIVTERKQSKLILSPLLFYESSLRLSLLSICNLINSLKASSSLKKTSQTALKSLICIFPFSQDLRRLEQQCMACCWQGISFNLCFLTSSLEGWRKHLMARRGRSEVMASFSSARQKTQCLRLSSSSVSPTSLVVTCSSASTTSDEYLIILFTMSKDLSPFLIISEQSRAGPQFRLWNSHILMTILSKMASRLNSVAFFLKQKLQKVKLSVTRRWFSIMCALNENRLHRFWMIALASRWKLDTPMISNSSAMVFPSSSRERSPSRNRKTRRVKSLSCGRQKLVALVSKAVNHWQSCRSAARRIFPLRSRSTTWITPTIRLMKISSSPQQSFAEGNSLNNRRQSQSSAKCPVSAWQAKYSMAASPQSLARQLTSQQQRTKVWATSSRSAGCSRRGWMVRAGTRFWRTSEEMARQLVKSCELRCEQAELGKSGSELQRVMYSTVTVSRKPGSWKSVMHSSHTFSGVLLNSTSVNSRLKKLVSPLAKACTRGRTERSRWEAKRRSVMELAYLPLELNSMSCWKQSEQQASRQIRIFVSTAALNRLLSSSLQCASSSFTSFSRCRCARCSPQRESRTEKAKCCYATKRARRDWSRCTSTSWWSLWAWQKPSGRHFSGSPQSQHPPNTEISSNWWPRCRSSSKHPRHRIEFSSVMHSRHLYARSPRFRIPPHSRLFVRGTSPAWFSRPSAPSNASFASFGACRCRWSVRSSSYSTGEPQGTETLRSLTNFSESLSTLSSNSFSFSKNMRYDTYNPTNSLITLSLTDGEEWSSDLIKIKGFCVEEAVVGGLLHQVGGGDCEPHEALLAWSCAPPPLEVLAEEGVVIVVEGVLRPRDLPPRVEAPLREGLEHALLELPEVGPERLLVRPPALSLGGAPQRLEDLREVVHVDLVVDAPVEQQHLQGLEALLQRFALLACEQGLKPVLLAPCEGLPLVEAALQEGGMPLAQEGDRLNLAASGLHHLLFVYYQLHQHASHRVSLHEQGQRVCPGKLYEVSEVLSEEEGGGQARDGLLGGRERLHDQFVGEFAGDDVLDDRLIETVLEGGVVADGQALPAGVVLQALLEPRRDLALLDPAPGQFHRGHSLLLGGLGRGEGVVVHHLLEVAREEDGLGVVVGLRTAAVVAHLRHLDLLVLDLRLALAPR